jgi:Xaa-Pro dipeptidase
MYYLTGYDAFGYVFFQCLYMGADGEILTLLTPDVRQAEHTSVVEDIRVWYDAEGADPAWDLREILEEHGCRGRRLGIETDAYGLTGYNLKRVEAARLADLGLDRAVEVAAPGVFEGGGDFPANEVIIGPAPSCSAQPPACAAWTLSTSCLWSGPAPTGTITRP